MFLRQLDLTTALRPSLYEDEKLLFVAERVGLYEGKFKIENYQNGSAYLTSHRICYVDNEDPRQYSVAVDLKEIERTEFYSGFLKSSPKITLFPKPVKPYSHGIKSPVPQHGSPKQATFGNGSMRPVSQSPAPTRDVNATWVCSICGLPNPIPSNFDPSTANQHTPLAACLACGIKPTLVHVVKAAIAAMSNRTPGASSSPQLPQRNSTGAHDGLIAAGSPTPIPPAIRASTQCPRCTFQNHPSLSNCEMCGASLLTQDPPILQQPATRAPRPESPGPSTNGSIVGDETIETIKFSFRGGGEKTFLERLKEALVQRKWLLQSAPPVPKPIRVGTPNQASTGQLSNSYPRTGTPQQRIVGIAGLEQREAELRESNKTVISTAFEDLEALMTSAKEVIAMAEQFARQMDQGSTNESADARNLLSDSAAALGLVTTKDMLGPGSASETLYITELARNLAEFLTDDRRGILRKEGGIMSLVDLWAVFNRTRNGIELISPLDFEKAALLWETLHLPIRLRRFKSGLLVVQEKSRTDEKTIASLLTWVRVPPQQESVVAEQPVPPTFGKGVTAQETAERFGWSVGVAAEELEMAEDFGALCRDQCLDGTRFWENHFLSGGTFASTEAMTAASNMFAGLTVDRYEV